MSRPHQREVAAIDRDLFAGLPGLSVGSFVQTWRCSVHRNASRQAVGKYIIGTQRNEHMVIAGIGGNRMGGARCVKEGPVVTAGTLKVGTSCLRA